MYDTELQSKRLHALPMDGSQAILSKQKAAALGFCRNSMHDCITSVSAAAVCLTHTMFATVRGTPTHMSVHITVIRQSVGSTYQAGS